MLNEQDSSMTANAVIHRYNQACGFIEQASTMPSVLYKPKIYKDGNKWCCLLGKNIQEGICGFGDSPHEATEDFNKVFYGTKS
jgi:hypothetical protein